MSLKKNDLPDRLVLVVGTYDGVICGFDTQKRETSMNDTNNNSSSVMNLLHQAQDREEQQKNGEDDYLRMNFAMAVHDASLRCLSISSTSSDDSTTNKRKRKNDEGNNNMVSPGMLLTGGYDDTLNIFQLNKYQQAGELKTPSDLGSPTCSSFAPPNVVNPGYAMVGTTSGKIVLYKRRDWSLHHILSGHTTAGVSCLAVHPSGKMALSGGVRDGKLILWDLLRGRLAFVNKIPGKTKCTIQHIVWSFDGTYYAYCTDTGNIVVRSTLDNTVVLLDIVLTSRANQLAFIGDHTSNNILVAAACNDGSLPVFSIVGEEEERNAIMAIEPAESNQERFKCIQHISNYKVVTANSHGICSIIDLQGAANMIFQQQSNDDDDDDAAKIITSVRVGSGARITTMAVWNSPTTNTTTDKDDVKEPKETPVINDEKEEEEEEEEESKPQTKKVKVGPKGNQIEMDADELEKARKLIKQAKKKQTKKKKKKKTRQQSS